MILRDNTTRQSVAPIASDEILETPIAVLSDRRLGLLFDRDVDTLHFHGIRNLGDLADLDDAALRRLSRLRTAYEDIREARSVVERAVQLMTDNIADA